MSGNKKELKSMAKKHGWSLRDYQPEIGLLSFHKVIDRSTARINIYLTKMTVGTALNHPIQGKTQLFRKRVDMELMARIFENPRVHTPYGYKRK